MNAGSHPGRPNVCSSCAWSDALDAMVQLRSYKLGRMHAWVEKHRHVTNEMWIAIRKVADGKGIRVPIPEYLKE